MSTFRVNKNVNYTVMSNHHLQDKRLSLKAKGLLSYLRTTILNAPTTMEHYYQAQGNWLTAQSRKK